MAATKRTKTERERALAETARLDRQGHSQAEIARRLEVTQQQVSYDLKKVREAYCKATQAERQAQVEEKRAQYRDVRSTAWDAFGRQDDNAFLRTVIETLRDESALLGLDAPKQVDARVSMNWDELWKKAGDGEFDGVEKELAEYEARLREGETVPEGEGGRPA